ncbi:hypothetical protein [Streptomyces sp. NPDC050560]|uniref:effector-associated constant component EACC1 n=1 Tax=Streptomyces sp. NPDC050560 TaxID=3365630 RepID=UPI00378CF7BC
MRVRILADGDEEALGELRTWLSEDPGTARVPVAAVGGGAGGESGARTMGALDALDVVLGSAVEVANFALAYVTWRSSRPSPPSGGTGALQLVHGGATVDIGHLSADELAELLRGLDGEGDTAGGGEDGAA